MLQAKGTEPIAEEAGRIPGCCLSPWRRGKFFWKLDAWGRPLIPLLAEDCHAARHKARLKEAWAVPPLVLWELSREELWLPGLCRPRSELRWRLRKQRQRRLSSRQRRGCRILGCMLGSLAARLKRSDAELAVAA